MPKTPTLLNGRPLAAEILNGIKTKVEKLKDKPHIAIILVGEDKASKIFIGLKEKACKDLGILSTVFRFKDNEVENAVSGVIQKLNEDGTIHGILIQLPLPDQIDEINLLGEVSPEKDVDGLNPKNIGNLLLGGEPLVPCTVGAIMEILADANIALEGKNVVIISRSNLIGKPLAMMLVKNSATVTICHSKTKNLADHTRAADVVITAAGVPNLITAEMIKPNTVVIDAGCAKKDGRMLGDVDFETVSKKVSAITPVPGGIGPLTVAMTMKNLIKCYESQKHLGRNAKG